MKTVLYYFGAGCVSALLGIACAGAAAFIPWHDNTEDIKKNIRAALPINIDDYADGCANPEFCFFTENVLEEYEYDDVHCIKYSDDKVEDLGECEVYVDLSTYQYIHEAVLTGEHSSGIITPVGEAECGYRIYTYRPGKNK